jgi:hypothetical protein
VAEQNSLALVLNLLALPKMLIVTEIYRQVVLYALLVYMEVNWFSFIKFCGRNVSACAQCMNITDFVRIQ